MHKSMLLLALVALDMADAKAYSSSFEASSASDFVMSGGSQVEANPLNSIRSGSPGQHSVVAFKVPLSPGIVVERVSFQYRYLTGFGPNGVGSNFSLRVAKSSVYGSPHYTNYSYNHNRSDYSPPINVNTAGLSIQVPKSGISQLEFNFDNNGRNMQLLLPITVTVTCTGGPCGAFPLVPTFIDSNMVLQRAPLRANLWGRHAMPGEKVSAKLDGSKIIGTATVDAHTGAWTMALEPQQAGTGHTLTLQWSVSGFQRVLRNIAFGDVYFCSGQSNMEFSLNNAFNASEEILDSVHYPGIRMFTAAKEVADMVQADVDSKPGPKGVYANSTWAVSAPGAFSPVGGTGFSWFSAVCYLFGRDLYKGLDGKVPIGLVASDWGGQPIEVFSSPDALSDKTCGGTRNHTDQWALPQPRHEPEPDPLGKAMVGNSELWFAMISPFAPMRFTGAVWYQGENNAGYAHGYSCTFPAMIADWRSKFKLPDMSFFFVQLAAYFQDYSAIRNAQMAALQLPNTGYAVAIDIGDAHSPVNPIHPRRKQEVGRRLSLSALKVQYGQDVVSTGPVFASLGATSSNTAVVSYEKGTANGLHQAATADCDQVGSKLCCGESPFQVLSKNNEWVRAKYTFKGQQVVLQVPTGSKVPTAVRYAWEAWPQCSLYNGVGGPDNHTGIAATPWCWDGAKRCAW